MTDKIFLELIGNLSNPGRRTVALKNISHILGIEDLLIFSRDPVLDVLLPSPGFPQTLPEGRKWKTFVETCRTQGKCTAELPSPHTGKEVRAVGIHTEGGSVIVLLGGEPYFQKVDELLLLIPIIVSALDNERISLIAKGQIEVENLYTERFRVLANALEETRRSLEGELRRSYSILSSITDAFISLDLNWKIVEMNAKAEEVLATKKDKMVGKNIWDLYPEARHSKIYDYYSEALLTQKTQVFEEFLKATNAWFEIRVYPSKDGLAIYFTDITQRRQIAEELISALQERDRSLEVLTTINHVGQRLTSELDLEKVVQQVTDDATRLTGAQFGAFFYNLVDAEGKKLLLNVVSGVSKDEFSRFPNPRATKIFHPTFVGAGTVRSGDITKDPRYGLNAPYKGIPPGHLPVKSYLAVSVISRTGEVIGGLFFGHAKPDVFTKQAEQIAEGLAAQTAIAMDNALLYRKVQESVRARDEFLSIASHELKTPLTSLKLQSQLRGRKLQRGDLGSFSPATLKSMFEKDDRQIARLSRLIDDMLDISHLGSGKLSLIPEELDLCLLVKNVLETYSNQIQSYRGKVQLSCQTEVLGKWDRFRIEQVFTNLLTNALRYGNFKPIDIRVWRNERDGFLEVRDQGIGIAKENRNRIFERFERAVSANEVSGLGLGLYIVKRIVDMHSGSITVTSELGKGSSFIVRLPLEGPSEINASPSGDFV